MNEKQSVLKSKMIKKRKIAEVKILKESLNSTSFSLNGDEIDHSNNIKSGEKNAFSDNLRKVVIALSCECSVAAHLVATCISIV